MARARILSLDLVCVRGRVKILFVSVRLLRLFEKRECCASGTVYEEGRGGIRYPEVKARVRLQVCPRRPPRYPPPETTRGAGDVYKRGAQGGMVVSAGPDGSASPVPRVSEPRRAETGGGRELPLTRSAESPDNVLVATRRTALATCQPRARWRRVSDFLPETPADGLPWVAVRFWAIPSPSQANAARRVSSKG